MTPRLYRRPLPVPHVLHLVTRDLVADPRALRAAKAGRDAGFRVTAVCMMPSGVVPTPVEAIEVVAVRGGGWSGALRWRRGPAATVPAGRGRWNELRGLWRIGRQLAWASRVAMHRLEADIVHAHDFETLPAALALRPSALVYDAHELYADWEINMPRVYRQWIRRVEGGGARRAAAVITVTEPIADILASRYRIRRPSVVLNVPDVVPRTSQPDALADRPRAIYQGVLTEARGLDLLAQAAALVPEVDVFVRGYGPLEERMRANEHVTLLEPVKPDAMVDGLSGFHIGIVPYLPTSLNNALCLPNKLFEYMAAGLAVVASDLRELRRVVADCDAGELFAPNDAASLAGAMRKLAKSARLRTARRNSLRAMRDPYSWDQQAERLLAVYRAAVPVS